MAATITVRLPVGLTALDVGGVTYAATDGYITGVPAEYAGAMKALGHPVLFGEPSAARKAAWAAATVTVRAADVVESLTLGNKVYPAVDGYVAGVPAQYGPELAAAGFIVVNGRSAVTPEGGIAVLMVNKNAAAAVPGTLVSPGTADFGFVDSLANANDIIGVVYEAAPADAPCLVLVGGFADVLFADGQAPAIGSWASVSAATAGRAGVSATAPANRVGLCVEAKEAGTDVIARVALHFT